MKLIILCVIMYFLCCQAFCSLASNNLISPNVHKQFYYSQNNKFVKNSSEYSCLEKRMRKIFSSNDVIATNTANGIASGKTIAKTSLKDIVAKAFGYLIGIGAMTVYSPIAFNIIASKSAEGYSITTWIFNVLGLSAASLYPLKKGFPISSFIELLSLAFQSIFLMGIICFYQGHMTEFSIFMLVFGVISSLFLKYEVSNKVLSSVQLFAIIACNYANIPQIILNYQQQKASWSIVTALLSVVGNFVRILTTMHLTKDKLIMFGYCLGFLTNGILFLQVLFYK